MLSNLPARLQFLAKLNKMLPGVILVAIVTAIAYGLRQVPGLGAVSPLFSAMLVGMLFANFTTVPSATIPGIQMLGKKMLRLAVALLGLQLTLAQVFEIGLTGMLLLVAIVALTYAFTLLAGQWLGVSPGLARLLAAGTSICGASAIAAANSVEQAKEEEVSYAIACITLFGTLAIVAYPVAAILIDMDVLDFGFWTGASIHEVAQVVATGFQRGDQAGEFAVVVKLSRVLLLAPVLIAAVFLASRHHEKSDGLELSKSQMFPVFVSAFIVLMLANSAGIVPEAIRSVIVEITPMMLAAALGALGLGTQFSALRAYGIRPLLLAALATMFISMTSLLALPLLG